MKNAVLRTQGGSIRHYLLYKGGMARLRNIALDIERILISEAIRNDPSEHRVARLMLVILGGSAISCVVLLFFSFMTSQNEGWVDLGLLIGHLLVCSSVFLMRHVETMTWPTRALALLGALQLVLATAISGGPDSNVIYAMPVLPIFLSALVDIRTNIAASLVVMLGVAGVFVVDQFVQPFPELENSSMETFFTLFWVMFMAMGIGVYSQFQANRLLGVAEQELEQRKRAQAELARVNESKDRFLAYMSHEIRNPMAAMVGAADLLSMDAMKAEHPRYLESLKNSANSLMEIVDAVLDFSQMDAGGMHLELAPLSIQPFLTDVISLFSASAEASGVRLTFEVNPGAPSAVIADPTRLRQVFSNLLSNAIKFSNPGGEVRVHVEPGRDGGVYFGIEDSGLGIRREDQDKIFEPYQRSREGLTRQGTGLGLPIARVLLEHMGATLQLESELNEGSRFHFVLAAASGPSVPELSVTGETAISLDGKSVLVAEDNPMAAAVVLGILSAMGCQVRHAQNGEEAVSLFAELEPDCVVMDIQMPNVDGIEATRAIREIETATGKEETFILALTGEMHREAIHESGVFNGLLQKPVSRTDLLRAILKSA